MSGLTGQLGRFSLQGLRSDVRPMHQPRIAWINPGWLCVVAGLALSLIGVVAIGTVTRGETSPDYALKHFAHIIVGIVAAALAVLPNYRFAQKASYALLILTLLLLIFVLLPVVPESIVSPRNGARRWINLYVTDFQPSELAKIAYVLALAYYLRFRSNYRTIRGLLLPLILTFIPMSLVLVEPDLGTAMLFLPTFFAMLIAAGAKIKHLILVVVLGLSLAPAMYPLLQPHQKARIKAMGAQITGSDKYEDDIGYQGAAAMRLVGAGRMTGVGKAHADSLIQHNHLPEDHNDMIFAVIACRWGALGALATWGAMILFCLGGLLTAANCKDPFGRLVAVGIVGIIFAQTTINTGMTIGLFPITGMTLPFVSSGGTSLVAAWIMVGLIMNIALRRPQHLARHSFEFEDAPERAAHAELRHARPPR